MKNRKDPQRLYETLLDKNTIFKPYIDLISKTTLFDLFYVLNGTPDHIPKPDEFFYSGLLVF
jgi:hypothetical protein